MSCGTNFRLPTALSARFYGRDIFPVVITSLIIPIRKRRGNALNLVAFWNTSGDPESISILIALALKKTQFVLVLTLQRLLKLQDFN